MLSRRIVVADNDPGITDLLLVDLQAEGHGVVASASEGEEAYRLCVEHFASFHGFRTPSP